MPRYQNRLSGKETKWYHLMSGHIPAHTHAYAWPALHIEHLCLLFNCGHTQFKSCWMDPDWMQHVLECEANRNWTEKHLFTGRAQSSPFFSGCTKPDGAKEKSVHRTFFNFYLFIFFIYFPHLIEELMALIKLRPDFFMYACMFLVVII